jgi:hypothetical protein
MVNKKADNTDCLNKLFSKMPKSLMASFDEFTPSLVRLLLNLVGKYCKMYSEKLKFSTLLN